MNGLRYAAARTPYRAQPQVIPRYGRTAVYRRLLNLNIQCSSIGSARTPLWTLWSSSLPDSTRDGLAAIGATRSIHYGARLAQENKDTVNGAPKKNPRSSKTGEEADESRANPGESSSGEGAKNEREGDKNKEKEDKKDEPPPPPHGDKSPWQVFTETLQSEFKASKEWNESTKALASSAHQFTESESVKRARQAYEASSSAVSSTTVNVLKTTAGAVGKGAVWTWETPVVKGVRSTVNATGNLIEKGTRPLRETEAFKNVKNVIDDGSSSKYGGWVEKEERRKARERREQEEQAGRSGRRKEVPKEDPNAGTNVTLHKDAAWKESWREFRDSNKFMQSLFSIKSAYNESENPFVSTARSISDTIAGFFAENEAAKAIKKFREIDPSFQIEPFLRELRDYILPEVLDAYVKRDSETLKLWLSSAQFSVYDADTKRFIAASLKADGRILDIRHVDIVSARIIEPGEVPVFIITCRTQELHTYRDLKTNETATKFGEDKVQLMTYVIGITRVPEDVNNSETRGWRLIELQKHGRDYI